ncbi:MAG: protein kinase [Anaerolinea sp.]|nr:protein kinase [Anaerolinea sp.]
MSVNQLTGKEIDDYVLEERIGRGATADVYRARQKSVKRQVAIKIINPHYNLDDQATFRQRFEREAKIIASLEHIHILPVHDYGVTHDGIAYLVMRLLRGGSLDELIAKAPLTLERALALFSQIASAVHYGHERGIIHRDIKPTNILLDEFGNAYVTDFGLAKFADHPSISLTKSGYIVGAPAYCSPEQLRDLEVDRRSDVYSLGVLLYTMLVGHPPYAKITDGVLDIIDKQINVPPPPPSTYRAGLPAEIEELILCALEKNPSDRFVSAQAMLDALTAWSGGQPIPVVTSASIAVAPVTAAPVLQQNRAAEHPLLRLYVVGTVGVILLLVLLFALSQVIGRSGFGSTTPSYTIDDNERGLIGDTVPSEGEIRLAQARLGADGFVAYIACTASTQIHASRARAMTDLLAQHNIPLRLYDAQMDRLLQADLIERALDEGAQAIVVCPLDDDVMVTALLRADSQHVPVVFTAPVNTSMDAVMIDADNRYIGAQVGREAGRVIQQELGGNASVVTLGYSQFSSSIDRIEAMSAGMLEVAPAAQIVGVYETNATREGGYETMSRVLDDGVAFDVILCISDATAYGVILALEEAGIPPGDVRIFSVNGESLAQQYIQDNHYLRASIEVPGSEIAQIAVNAVLKLLGDGALPQYIVLSHGQLLTRESLESGS